MSEIIAARFDTFPDAEETARDLVDHGVDRKDVSIVYVNNAGQHATYAIGGDMRADRGAKEAHKGATAGALVGGAAGAVVGAATFAVPSLPPAAAGAAVGVGAYTGALAGSLIASGRKSEQAECLPSEGAVCEQPENQVRAAGVLLAAKVGEGHQEQPVIEAFRAHGGKDIERAEGE